MESTTTRRALDLDRCVAIVVNSKLAGNVSVASARVCFEKNASFVAKLKGSVIDSLESARPKTGEYNWYEYETYTYTLDILEHSDNVRA